MSLTVFFKYGEEELIGEGVQAIGDEDAEAYIRQEVGVHMNPVIAEYDDPDDCERKEQFFEIRLQTVFLVCVGTVIMFSQRPSTSVKRTIY